MMNTIKQLKKDIREFATDVRQGLFVEFGVEAIELGAECGAEEYGEFAYCCR